MRRESDEFPVRVDRNVYPEPEWRFKDARIGLTYDDSKPDFPPPKRPAERSPNILLVLLDDVGFGWPSVNGGLVEMPTAERIAKNGLQYNQFHTTALCSPTRAALLTGRNHHTVGTGVIQEMAAGYPGYCGIIPKGTKLTERPEQIPAWDDQSDEAKKLFARQAENYADFLEHTDYEVGRIVDALGGMRELENTLIIYLLGDNGSSSEGSLIGTPNELLCLNGMQPTYDQVKRHYDDWGKPGTSPHYAVGWAWAGDAPFQWTKQIASHFGGTRNGMVIQWPLHIEDKGTKRFQFHHCIDIAPTILEVAGISEPSMVNGVPQKPIEGVSIAYTFSRENREAPSHRYQQYFEMFGNRAMYHGGWMASCFHGRLPWLSSGSVPFSDEKWELYNIAEDFSQSDDLADKHSEKLRELQDLFMADAAKYNVLPLDDRFTERLDVTLRPSFFYGRKHIVFYPGMVRLPEGSAPKTTSISHTITVDAVVPKGGAEGVLICVGGDTAGWTFYVENGKLRYHYNYFDVERYDIVSNEDVPKGDVRLKADVTCEAQTPGGPAMVRLFINDRSVAEGRLEKQVPQRFGVESLDVGMDALSAVNKAYESKLPFAFTGEIRSVTFDLVGKEPEPTGQERLELHARMD